MRRTLRNGLAAAGLIAAFGVPAYLQRRAVRLNAALIDAARYHDVASQVAYLNDGADGNAAVQIVDRRNVLARVWDSVRRVKPARPRTDTALLLSLDARAEGLDFVSFVLPDDPELCRLYLAKGADPNVRDNLGNTPLMSAVFQGMNRTAAVLMDRGADCNIANNEGYTPLMVAAVAKDVPMVRQLLAHGARANAVQKAGHSILGLVDDLEQSWDSYDPAAGKGFHEIDGLLRRSPGATTQKVQANAPANM